MNLFAFFFLLALAACSDQENNISSKPSSTPCPALYHIEKQARIAEKLFDFEPCEADRLTNYYEAMQVQ